MEILGALSVETYLSVALLVAARIAPLTLIVPWIALPSSPFALRAVLLVALTFALAPIAGATALAPDGLAFAVALVREALIGAVFAVATAIPLFALDHAGRIIDAMRGASQAESISPMGEP